MNFNHIWVSIKEALLCLHSVGTPLILAVLTSIGAGFFINDLILFPIYFIALGFIVYFMRHNIKYHANTYPIMITIISGFFILGGIFITSLVWFGIIGLLFSSAWDFVLVKGNQR